jgi:hypothetical protein
LALRIARSTTDDAAQAGLCRWHAGCSTGTYEDFVFVAVTVAFFAVSWLYAKSFDHL